MVASLAHLHAVAHRTQRIYGRLAKIVIVIIILMNVTIVLDWLIKKLNL